MRVIASIFAHHSQAELEMYAKVLNNPGQIMPHGVFFLVDESDGPRTPRH